MDLTNLLTSARPSKQEYQSDDEAPSTSTAHNSGSKNKSTSSWKGLGLSPSLVKGLHHRGFSTPTPIQRSSLPYILSSPPRDVLAMARTGSGKTLSYIIPLLQSLRSHSPIYGARALIIVPTRELASQVLKVGKDLARAVRDKEEGEAIRWSLVVGGDRLEDQFDSMAGNPDVIIATPGRLLHVLVEMSLSLQNCSYVVFDEADRLFELNFSVQLYEILTRLPPSPIRQTLLFSATLPKTLVEFAKAGLQNPKLVRLDVESKISEDLQMAFLAMREEEKEAALFVLLRDVIGIEPSSNGGGTHQASSDEEGDGEGKGRKNGSRKGKKVEKKSQKKEEKQAIIFCSTKHHVEYLNALLISQYTVSTIYSSLDQVARRSHLSAFRDGRTQLLVVTDLAARGIDIPALDNVINFDFPPAPRAFVHRVGRTARAGRGGWAYSFVCGRGEAGYLYDLELFLSRRVQTSFEGEVNYQSNLLLGSFDRETMDEEVERVKELVGDKLGTTARLQQVAQRGRKAFEKGRAKPSNESTRRAKDLDLSSLKLHPVFRTSNISNDGGTVPRKTVSSHVMKGKEELLDKIKNFNARETVFEFGKKGEKTEAGVLMKKRRRELEGKVMKAAKRRKEEEAVSTLLREKEVVDEDKDELELEMAEEADLEDVFDMELPSTTARRNTNFREENYYLGYVQPGADTEKGYSMRDTSTFAAAAQAATFDLSGTREGDEIVDQPQKASIMRWDRRQKKLVKGDGTGADNKKMIRSESGKKIPASFKSGMFEEWKGKKKLKVPKVGERELEGVKSTAKKWRHSQVKEKKGLKGKGAGKGSGKSELKNVATIRKERAAKAKRKERSNQPSRKK